MPALNGNGQRKNYSSSATFSSKSYEWSTPLSLFSELHNEFNFTLDVCATPANAKCIDYFTTHVNGLIQRWKGRVWCNPPYGRGIGKWVKKAYQSVLAQEAEIAVCLLPARVDTSWWHDYCMRGEYRFFRGRLRFSNSGSNAPFPSVLVIFRLETLQ